MVNERSHLTDGHSSLLIYRQVSGAEEFLAQAAFWGDKIFGQDTVGIVEVPTDEMAENPGFDTKTLVEVGLPRVRLVDPAEMILHIFDRGAPRELNLGGKMRFALRKTIFSADRVYRPVSRDAPAGSEKFRTRDIYETTDSIGFMHGILDQKKVRLLCGGITAPLDYRSAGFNLSLLLNPAFDSTRMLTQHARAYLSGIAVHSKKVAYPAATTLLHIPFATLPADTTERQGLEYIEKMTKASRNLVLRAAGVETKVVD